MTMKITMILKWSRRRRGKTRINLRSPSFKDTMSEEYWMLRRIRRVTKSQNLLMLDRRRRRMLMQVKMNLAEMWRRKRRTPRREKLAAVVQGREVGKQPGEEERSPHLLHPL